MQNKLNCQQVVTRIKEIKSLKSCFEEELKKCNINKCLDLKNQLTLMIEEITEAYWPFEVLTKEVLEEQYTEQLEAMKAVEIIEYFDGKLGFIDANGKFEQFPTFPEVLEFVFDDAEFVDALKRKEKQGFVKLLVSPFSVYLDAMIPCIDIAVKDNGGKFNYRNADWGINVLNASLKYFASLDKDGNISGGRTKERLLADPSFRKKLLNGCMVSFCEEVENLSRKSDADIEVGGRKKIKCGYTFREYLNILKEEQYKNESSISPEEWFCLFAQKLYEKCIRSGNELEQLSEVFDTYSWTVFAENTFPSSYLPTVCWDEVELKILLESRSQVESGSFYGIRTVVRKFKK